jgi:CRP-like cAMP-binding protein
MSDHAQPVAVKYPRGSFIILEGKPSADRFYIIKKGWMQITRETDSVMPEEKVAGPGEMFGVVSAMASRSYIESAVTMSNVLLFAVNRSYISKSPPIAVNIIRQFSQRLRRLDEAFSRLTLKSVAVNDPSHLFHIGEYYEGAGKSNQALYAYQRYLAYFPDAEKTDIVKKRIAKMKSRATVIRPEYSSDTMVQSYPKGCLLFAEGEKGYNLYIIQEGSVKIVKIADEQEVVLAVLNKGDIFGEMAMLEDKPRAATAEIYEDSKLLSVNRSNFASLLNEHPEIVIRLTTLMAERIWLLYRQLTNTLIDNSLGRIYDTLLIQLEKNRVDLNTTNSYLCNFGFKELVGMAGISEEKTNELYGRVFSARRIIEENDKVLVHNVASILKEAEYYHKARKLKLHSG